MCLRLNESRVKPPGYLNFNPMEMQHCAAAQINLCPLELQENAIVIKYIY
jgi:hypothetical protein